MTAESIGRPGKIGPCDSNKNVWNEEKKAKKIIKSEGERQSNMMMMKIKWMNWPAGLRRIVAQSEKRMKSGAEKRRSSSIDARYLPVNG